MQITDQITRDLLNCAIPLQANVAVVIAAFKDGLQSQGYAFEHAPDAPAARNIHVVG